MTLSKSKISQKKLLYDIIKFWKDYLQCPFFFLLAVIIFRRVNNLMIALITTPFVFIWLYKLISIQILYPISLFSFVLFCFPDCQAKWLIQMLKAFLFSKMPLNYNKLLEDIKGDSYESRIMIFFLLFLGAIIFVSPFRLSCSSFCLAACPFQKSYPYLF